MSLLVASAAINVARDGHYEVRQFLNSGIPTRTLLLEGARTNSAQRSEDLSHAYWTKSQATISPNAALAPDGAMTADKVEEDNTNNSHSVSTSTFASLTAALSSTLSFFAKAAERGFVAIATADKAATVRLSWVNLADGSVTTQDAQHTLNIVEYGNGWWRIGVTFPNGTGGSTPSFVVATSNADGVSSYTGTTGYGIYLWGLQFEADSASPSSYIPTPASASVTRSADAFALPFPFTPQAMTWYVKFVERGTLLEPVANAAAILGVGASTNPALVLYAGAGGLYTLLHRRSGDVFSAVSTAVPVGFVAELRACLYGDGSVELGQTINSGVEEVASRSAANALASAWNDTILTVGNRGSGSSEGLLSLLSLKIARGVQTLTTMRAL